MPQTSKQERVELHSHLGAAVQPSILWSIAHRQGIKLPSKNYWDLDHIIMSAVWGADKSMLEYPQVKAGIILMMDRSLTYEQNEVIVQKAIKYRKFGIVGIDLAGPNRKSFSMKDHAKLFAQARRAGLGTTVHTGEENQLDEMRYVVSKIKPDRIGHGIECAGDANLVKAVSKNNITLEICPTSNLRNSVVKNIAQTQSIFRQLLKNKVKFAICTDGPEMYQTSIRKEQDFLLNNKILSKKELDQATIWAKQASFIR